MTEIIDTKSILQDGVNCWLQYVLAQPVDMDLRMFVFFVVQYSCVPTLLEWFEQARPIVTSFFKFSWDGKLLVQKLTLAKA